MARRDWDGQGEVDEKKGENSCLVSSLGVASLAYVCVFIFVPLLWKYVGGRWSV